MSDVVSPTSLSDLIQIYTPAAQIIVAFSLGVLLSPWTATFVVILFFLILWEIVIFALSRHPGLGEWNIVARLGVIFAYIAGWVLGRSLFESNHNILNTEDDHHMGCHLRGERRRRLHREKKE